MGCYIYGYCLSSLLKEATRESLVAAIKFVGEDLDYLPEFEHYKRIFDPNFEELTIDSIKSTGYVVDTLEAALWCVLTTDNYRDCVLKAVNLGDDTDTVAAVAGGLAGALYGYAGIPKEWLDTLKRRDYIEEMCERASSGWLT
jgi:ADP-ribosylglycohydrolase